MTIRPTRRAWQRPRTRHPAENKLVKSASRVFEILEFLDDMRRPTTVMEIAEALGYPQSSTSALLSSMVTMGYLVFEPRKRTYMTSSRVALLGSWVNEPFFAEGRLISTMKSLHAAFGQTVVLGMRNGTVVQYIHILQPPPDDRLFVPIGSSLPLAVCAAGHAMMATMPSDEVTRLALRYNADATDDARLINVRDLREDLAVVRERGYAALYGAVVRNGAMVGACLPEIPGQRPMAIAMGGPIETIRPIEAEIGAALMAAVADLRSAGADPADDAVEAQEPDLASETVALRRA